MSFFLRPRGHTPWWLGSACPHTRSLPTLLPRLHMAEGRIQGRRAPRSDESTQEAVRLLGGPSLIGMGVTEDLLEPQLMKCATSLAEPGREPGPRNAGGFKPMEQLTHPSGPTGGQSSHWGRRPTMPTQDTRYSEKNQPEKPENDSVG